MLLAILGNIRPSVDSHDDAALRHLLDDLARRKRRKRKQVVDDPIELKEELREIAAEVYAELPSEQIEVHPPLPLDRVLANSLRMEGLLRAYLRFLDDREEQDVEMLLVGD